MVVVATLGMSTTAHALDAVPDMLLFDPATDSGRYMSVHDAETLLQGRWSMGVYFDYARKPLELHELTTGSNFDVVRDAINGQVVGAFGITDWVQIGAAIPITFYQAFFDPNAQRISLGGAAKQQKAGLGDIRLEAKFRLLDIDRYNVGIAVVPYLLMPTGRKGTFISGERWSPGAKLAVEGNINDRVWLGANFGYQFIAHENQYFAGNANATIDDLLQFGLGARVRITDEWALIGEGLAETVAKSAFRVETQSPVELLGGFQYTPQRSPALRGLAFTLMAGGGVTRGVGAPKSHVIFGVSYPTPKIVTLHDRMLARVEEKIIITQKIHFAFNSAQIRAISYPILNDVAALLREHREISMVRVEGHTDSIGSAAYNNSLSQRRARSVVNYLIHQGVASYRLTAVGYGESRPIADNYTEEGRARNRRTEFTILR